MLISAAMIVRGFGIGMSMMPSMTAAYAVLRPDQINDATPQLTVLQRVGGSIGTAILTVVPPGGISGLGTPRRPPASRARSRDTYCGCWGSASSRCCPRSCWRSSSAAPARSRAPLPADVALEAVA